MMHLNGQPCEDLRSRLEMLEAQLSRLQARTPESRQRRFSFSWVQVLIPCLAFAGWALAQQEQQPAPAPGEPISDLIWKEGGITYVAAPFRVASPDGTILLSVIKDGDSSAAVSISYASGGLVAVNASGGGPMAVMGVKSSDGGGIVTANDKNGKQRAQLIGAGYITVQSESGKQLAGLIATPEGKGRVAVWAAAGKGQKVASLDEGADGSGMVTVSDKQVNPIAVISADPDGRGLIQVTDKGRTFAALGMNSVGAGLLRLAQPDGSTALLAAGSAGQVRGGLLAAFDADGNQAAFIGVGANGRGGVAINDEERTAASLSVGDDANGRLILRNKQGQESFLASGGGEDGQGNLLLSNGSGLPIVGLGMSDSGEGSLILIHNGVTVAELKSDTTGLGSMALSDASGEVRLAANAGSTEMPGGAVYAFNKNGRPVASLGSSADGRGEVTVSEEMREVAKLTTNIVGAGTLYLMNKTGDIGLDATGQADEGPAGGSVTSYSKDSVAASLGTADDGSGRIWVSAKNKPVAEISVNNQAGGGLFKAYNSQGKLVAGMGSDTDKGRLVVYGQNGGGLATLTEGPDGAGLIQVKNTSDRVVAGITGGQGNAGSVMVADSAGKTAAEMDVDRGVGRFTVWNSDGGAAAATMTRTGTGGAFQVFNSITNVGNLIVGPGGGGQLQLHDPAGVNMVEAGTLMKEGVGIVRAGPNLQCAGTKMGLANPDCVVGRLNK